MTSPDEAAAALAQIEATVANLPVRDLIVTNLHTAGLRYAAERGITENLIVITRITQLRGIYLDRWRVHIVESPDVERLDPAIIDELRLRVPAGRTLESLFVAGAEWAG